MRISLVFVVSFLALVFWTYEVESRGFRGGGYRGGGYRSSVRTSYRSSTRTRYGSSGSRVRVRVRQRSRVRGGYVRYGGGSLDWHTAATLGYISGWNHYHTRHYYYSHHSHNSFVPTICENHHDFNMGNGTAYTLFVCPQQNDRDSMDECCGPSDREYCCERKDKNEGGAIAGIVCLVIAALIFSCCICYFCCYKRKRTPPKTEITEAAIVYSAVPVRPEEKIAPNDEAPPYPVNPGGAVYPPNEGAPYPNQGAPYPNQGAPYPPANQGGPFMAPPIDANPPYPTPAVAPPPYPAQ